MRPFAQVPYPVEQIVERTVTVQRRVEVPYTVQVWANPVPPPPPSTLPLAPNTRFLPECLPKIPLCLRTISLPSLRLRSPSRWSRW